MTRDDGIGVHRDAFTDEIVASDTFEVPAQGKFYIAGEEVSERAYRRHESVCRERDLAMRAMCTYCHRRWTADQVHHGHHDVCGDCHRENQRARRQAGRFRSAISDALYLIEDDRGTSRPNHYVEVRNVLSEALNGHQIIPDTGGTK